jgi:hypothetical protein
LFALISWGTDRAEALRSYGIAATWAAILVVLGLVRLVEGPIDW